MSTEHQWTPEEEAYGTLLKDMWEACSEPARIILEEAQTEAYAACMVRTSSFRPEQYEVAMLKMRSAAAEITEHENELLGKFWRTALAAAASVDPCDLTPAGYQVHRGDVHHYYRMVSGMIERIWIEKPAAEILRMSPRVEPDEDDFSYIPF
jgi:hypothetical protein